MTGCDKRESLGSIDRFQHDIAFQSQRLRSGESHEDVILGQQNHWDMTFARPWKYLTTGH